MTGMSAHTVARGGRMPRAEREAQILTVAEAVFAERGYQATTMEDVAERVGVTKPMIYEYFGSKEGLLAACIANARTQLRDATFAAWQRMPEGADVEELFRAGIRAFFDFIDDHASAFALLVHESAIQAHAGALQAQLRLDTASPVMLEGYAEVVVGSCERVAVWRSGRTDVSAADATELVMSAVWHGLSSLAAPGS